MTDQTIGDSFASPRDPTSIDELEARLSNLSRRENRYRVYKHIAASAQLQLGPKATWLLLRLEDEPRFTVDGLATRFDLPAARLEPLLTELANQGLIARGGRAKRHVRAERRRSQRGLGTDPRGPPRRSSSGSSKAGGPISIPRCCSSSIGFARSLRAKPPAGEPVPA